MVGSVGAAGPPVSLLLSLDPTLEAYGFKVGAGLMGSCDLGSYLLRARVKKVQGGHQAKLVRRGMW